MLKKSLLCASFLIVMANAADLNNEPLRDTGGGVTGHVSINLGHPHPEEPFESVVAAPRNLDTYAVEIKDLRDKEVKKWGQSLLGSQFWWFRAGNVAEGVSQVCYVLAPILSFVGIKDSNASTAAGIIGVCGIGLQKFSKYAHGESTERGEAANKFLESARVDPIPVIKESRRTSSVA